MTNVSNFLKTTDANTSKYLTNQPYTDSFSSASVSVSVFSYATRNYTIPLSENTRAHELWVNLSLDGDVYIKMPNRPRVYGGGVRSISSTMSVDGGSIYLTLYLVNQSPTTQTFPSFTVNVIRRDYVDEF